MFSQFGPLEIVLVIVVLLLVFGTRRLPALGRQLGTGMREFKDSVTGEDRRREAAAEERPALDAPPAAPPAPAAPAAQPDDVRQPAEPRTPGAAHEPRA